MTKSIFSAISLSNLPIDPNEPLYCYCQQVSFGEMVACDNDEVNIYIEVENDVANQGFYLVWNRMVSSGMCWITDAPKRQMVLQELCRDAQDQTKEMIVSIGKILIILIIRSLSCPFLITLLIFTLFLCCSFLVSSSYILVYWLLYIKRLILYLQSRFWVLCWIHAHA